MSRISKRLFGFAALLLILVFAASPVISEGVLSEADGFIIADPAGCACQNGSFALRGPTVTAADGALGEAMKQTLSDAMQRICDAHDASAVFGLPEAAYSFVLQADWIADSILSVGWEGITSMPGAAYTPLEAFSVNISLTTGKAVALHELTDVKELALRFLQNPEEYHLSWDMDNPEQGEAQLDYLSSLTQADWEKLLTECDTAAYDVPCSRWLDPEDGTVWLLVNLPVPHAIGDVITMQMLWDDELGNG